MFPLSTLPSSSNFHHTDILRHGKTLCLIVSGSILLHEFVQSSFKLIQTLIIHSILRQRVQQLIICHERNLSLLFVLKKWRSLNSQCDWHNLDAMAGTKWLLEQKCSTCVKSMIAWERVHLCSRHVFSNVTGQCSALLLAVKLSLTYYCENYLKCWRGLGISYLSIKPRRKAYLSKLTITWTIHFRLIDYCWADWAYSFHVLNFTCNNSKSMSVSHNLLCASDLTFDSTSLCQSFLVFFQLETW